MSCGDLAVMLAPGFESLSFDPFSLFQDGLSPPDVDIGRGQIIDARVIAVVVVVIHEGFKAGLKISGEEVVFQQDAVLQGLVPSFNFALGLQVIWRTPSVLHTLVAQPCGQFPRDVAGAVIAQEARFMNNMNLITSRSLWMGHF